MSTPREYIDKLIAAAPPLTDGQWQKFAALVRVGTPATVLPATRVVGRLTREHGYPVPTIEEWVETLTSEARTAEAARAEEARRRVAIRRQIKRQKSAADIAIEVLTNKISGLRGSAPTPPAPDPIINYSQESA